MAKEMYEYKNVQVPVEAAEHINKIFNARSEAGNKSRKGAIWLEAALKVKK